MNIALALGPERSPVASFGKQCGVKHAVGHLSLEPKPELDIGDDQQPFSTPSLTRYKAQYEQNGYRLSVIESRPPMEKIKLAQSGRIWKSNLGSGIFGKSNFRIGYFLRCFFGCVVSGVEFFLIENLSEKIRPPKKSTIRLRVGKFLVSNSSPFQIRPTCESSSSENSPSENLLEKIRLPKFFKKFCFLRCQLKLVYIPS